MAPSAALVIGSSDPPTGIDCATIAEVVCPSCHSQLRAQCTCCAEHLGATAVRCDLIVLCE